MRTGWILVIFLILASPSRAVITLDPLDSDMISVSNGPPTFPPTPGTGTFSGESFIQNASTNATELNRSAESSQATVQESSSIPVQDAMLVAIFLVMILACSLVYYYQKKKKEVNRNGK